MTEPVAWIHHISDNDDREHTIVDFERTHPMSVHNGDIPLYAHPAPAPASLRDMTEADFDKAHGIAPAGVPDVEWLIKVLNNYHDNSYSSAFGNKDTIFKKAATALAALQSQVRELRLDLEETTLREHKTEKRQAECIKELTATLAEAVGLLEEALPSIETVANSFENTQDKWHAAFVHRIKAAIVKASEVMG